MLNFVLNPNKSNDLRINRKKVPWQNINYLPLVSFFSTFLLLSIWFLASNLGWVSPFFLPSPQKVFHTFTILLQQGYVDTTLAQHIKASLFRVLTALILALLSAIPLGILMGSNAIARASFDPFIEFYRPIPPLAYLPLIVIWFGIGETSKILLIYLAIFAPLTISTAQAVRKIDKTRIHAISCLGATRWQIIKLVVLPSIFPDLLTGIRIALGVGWSTLVASELIAANQGLGFMVQSAAQFLATDVVITGILLIAFIALAIELGLRQIQKQFASWSIHDHHH